MTPEEQEQLEIHLRAIAGILFKNTPAESLQDFEGLELALREHWLTTVGPALGSFFVNRQPEQVRVADGR